MNGTDAPRMDEVTPTAPATPGAMAGRRRRRRRRTPLERFRQELIKRLDPLLTTILSLVVLGSLLAVGTIHVRVLLFVAPVALLGAVIVAFADDDLKKMHARASLGGRRVVAVLPASVPAHSLELATSPITGVGSNLGRCQANHWRKRAQSRIDQR